MPSSFSGSAYRKTAEEILAALGVHRDQKKTHSRKVLAVGDLIHLRAGDVVPADGRLISCQGLRVDETVLTGLPHPQTKITHTLDGRTALSERRNMVYQGTTIVSGEAQVVVTAIGTHTELAKHHQVQKAHTLPSVDETGILFVDVADLLAPTIPNASDIELLGKNDHLQGLAHTAVEVTIPTQPRGATQWRPRSVIPYSDDHQYTAVLCDHPHQAMKVLFVTGDPEAVLARSSSTIDASGAVHDLTSERRFELLRTITTHEAQGRQLIGIAVRRAMHATHITDKNIHELLFLGWLNTVPNIRNEIKSVVARAHKRGVAVKLITSASPHFARAVARTLGLTITDDAIYLGAELEAMRDTQFRSVIPHTVLFARMTPLETKRLIRLVNHAHHSRSRRPR